MPLSKANQEQWHQTQGEIPAGSSVSELVRRVEARSQVELSLPAGERRTVLKVMCV